MTYEVIHERLKRVRSIWVLDAKTCEFITSFPVNDLEAENCGAGTFCNGYAVVYLDEDGDYVYDPE